MQDNTQKYAVIYYWYKASRFKNIYFIIGTIFLAASGIFIGIGTCISTTNDYLVTGFFFVLSAIMMIIFMNFTNDGCCYDYQESILCYYSKSIAIAENIPDDIELYKNHSIKEIKQSIQYLRYFSDYRKCKIYRNADLLEIDTETNIEDLKKTVFLSDLIWFFIFISLTILHVYILCIISGGILGIIYKLIASVIIMITEFVLGYSDSVYRFIININDNEIKEFQDSRKKSNNRRRAEISFAKQIYEDLCTLSFDIELARKEFQRKLKEAEE